MINTFEDYKKLLENKYSEENIFQYFLLKSELEYKLDEIIKSRESFLEAIKFVKYNDNALVLMIELAIQCDEWESLFKVFDKYRLVDIHINNKFVKSVYLIYNIFKGDNGININEIISGCTDDIEKSILAYLISQIVEDKSLEKEYCKVSYKMWKDNLAAAKKLYYMNERVCIKEIERLIRLDKIQDTDITLGKCDRKSNFRFIPLGGGNDIGASSYYLEINETSLLVDAGIKIKGEEIENPNFNILSKDKIEKLKYVIITHAHLDHCGAIVDLYKLNSKIRFIMTSSTRKLIKENFKLAGKDKEYLNKLDIILERTISLEFNKKFIIDDISIELYRAGHILGAASVFIKSNKCNIFITGDFSIRDQNTVKGIELPKEKVDVLIIENTYGNKEQKKSYTFEHAEMMHYISEKLLEGKQVLIPAFSIGRSQEIIADINSNVKVDRFRTYIDGGSIDITKLYEKILDKKIKRTNNYYTNTGFYSNKEDFIFEEIMNNTCCIVSSSGMILEGSASAEYAKKILPSENGVCILTGYQAHGTIGYRLKKQMEMNCDRYINIEEKSYKILSELKSFNLSAHANLSEILAIQLYLKAGDVILVHGEYREDESLIEKKMKRIKGVNIHQSINNKEVCL